MVGEATPQEQAENRRSNRKITINGRTQTLTAWAREIGIADTALLYRLKQGLTGDALLRPGRHGKTLTAEAEARQRRDETNMLSQP